MKPKRCTAQYPFTGTFQSGRRCTLEVGHTGPHTIIPPSGMDYAPDWEPCVVTEEIEEGSRCPACGYIDRDAWEMFRKPTDHYAEVQCGSCGVWLEITQEVTYSYLTALRGVAIP